MVRLLGLRFLDWRMRSSQATGGGEVDVMAASDKFVYSRWQIQCKNIQADCTVGVDVIAKEVGMTFVTHADVLMFVTTGEFSSDAVTFANQVMGNSRYYIVFVDRHGIAKIQADRTAIMDILDAQAQYVFARKEQRLLEVAERAADLDTDDAAVNAAIQRQVGVATHPLTGDDKEETDAPVASGTQLSGVFDESLPETEESDILSIEDDAPKSNVSDEQ
jgi:hypothetical protein